MERVKECWQGILKEREDFWSSFFNKYQEDKKDVDFRSYMDNSSKRVNTLLELAAEESDNSKGLDKKVIQYFEEQSSESSETYLNEVTTSLNENQEQKKLENLKPGEPSVISVKKIAPTLVLEANPEEKGAQYLLTKNSPNLFNKLISESSESSDCTVSQYFEGKSSDSSEAKSDVRATQSNEEKEEQKYENLKPFQLPVVIVKKIVPNLALEVNQEKEDAKCLLSRNTHSPQKFISEILNGSDLKEDLEELTSESSQPYSHEVFIPSKLPVVILKKIVPNFALEVNPEKEDAKCFSSRNTHPPQKFISDGLLNGSDLKENLEELASESSQPYSHEVSIPLNGDQEEQKVEILKPVEPSVVLMKRSVPTFVLEVNPKEEMAKCLLSRNSHSAKKFKLFESSPHPKENVQDSIIHDQCNSKCSNESIASTLSDDDSFKKIICHRIKPPRNKHVSNPKRFKLM